MSSFDAAAARARSDAPSLIRLPVPIRLALRELRFGLRGFYVFIACMALGVGVITAVGALNDALRAGFDAQSAEILGGDAAFVRVHKRATPDERAWLDAQGRVSETATMRAMARAGAGAEHALIELKGVDGAYPLVGRVQLAGSTRLKTILATPGSAVVSPLLLERLGLMVGDTVRLGRSDVVIRGVVEHEPDGISGRLSYGPRVLVGLKTLMATGLVQPGTLIRWRYAINLPTADGDTLQALKASATEVLPEAGFLYADRRDPSPRVTRVLDWLRQFLTLIGLTSLLIGGVGVANAVATFIDRRRKVIGVMRSLGATGRTVFGVFVTQVMAIAALGIGVGLVLGYALPVVLDVAYGALLPVRATFVITPLSVGLAVAYGLLVAAIFTLWPLGRTEQIRAGVLFREEVAPQRVIPGWHIIALTGLAVVALVMLAVAGSDSWRFAAYFLGAVAAVLTIFAVLGWLVTRGIRQAPRPAQAELRLALGNIAAPDGLTRSVILSLGAGLSLLVAVALTDASIVGTLTTRAVTERPSYFVLDIKRSERESFRRLVESVAPKAQLREAPMLRGRIVRLNGIPVDQLRLPRESRWLLEGDRGLSYASQLPDGSTIVAGQWWPADYQGPPLVSFDATTAKELALSVGDTVTVNVLGRNLKARVASLREVKWESLSINFFMVFSPNALRAAPHNILATITLPDPVDLSREAALARAVADQLPSATMIRVKDALDAFQAILSRVMLAVRVAGGVTLLAGALVLAGAMATAQRRRIKQAVILKTLGATRRRIMLSHLAEYAVLALITAVLAVGLGSLCAWFAITQFMELEFVFSGAAVVQTLGLAIVLVMVFGVCGTWAVLRAPAVVTLRSE